MAEVDGSLQLLLIERPPLGAAIAASIRQRGRTTGAVPREPALGATEADPVFGRQFGKTAAMVQVLGHEPETARLCRLNLVRQNC